MIQFNNTTKGRYKTIRLTELEQYPGWQLIALVPGVEVTTSWGNDGRAASAPLPITYAVVFEDEESVLVELQRRLEMANANSHRLEQDLSGARRELEKEKAKVVELEASRNVQAERVVGYMKSVEELNASKRKLEVDLGKLRAHFGEKVFNEVVGR